MQSKICCKNGNFCIEINGKDYSFAATRSFRPEGRILKQFSEHGLKFFNIFPSGIMTALENRTVPYSKFGPVWTGEDEYNWDNLRAQCREVFDNISSDTYVSVNVHLDPPPWYVESHEGFVDHWEQMIQNLGSEQWRNDAAKYLCALVDKLDEWYPERIYAVFLLCGGTTEWYSYHIDKVIQNPTEIQKSAYRAYCADERAEIPSADELHGAADGVIRCKSGQAEAIKYWRFTNDIVADTILYFAEVAKKHTHNSRIVGLFSGHIYGQNLDFAVQTSYNSLSRLLKSPNIDMLFCPASYLFRSLDSTSGIRVPIDSIRCHGKLFSHEVDSSTHLLKNVKETAATSHAACDETFACGTDTIMYMRREVGMVLAKGQGYWWFDMFSGYYDDPELMNEIERLHEIQESILSVGSNSISEVCEMLDEESNYYLKTNTHYPMAEHQTEALNGTAVPWDMNMTFDFDSDSFNEEQYKLYIFPCLFAPTERVTNKISDLRLKGKSMLYFHAPYYAAESELSASVMEKHTGIHFEKCDLKDNTIRLSFEGAEHITYDFTDKTVKGDIWKNRDKTRNITPIFSPTNLDVVLGRFEENGKPACGLKFRDDGGFDAFSACAPIPAELLKEFYRYANIFVYADKNMPVYTSDSFECVYSRDGGEITLYRPEQSVLTECFGKEKYTVGRDGTTVMFKPHETKFFYVDNN